MPSESHEDGDAEGLVDSRDAFEFGGHGCKGILANCQLRGASKNEEPMQTPVFRV